ncbi:MAG: DNA cytosine methyltransferase [Saprospiraceae bacterium]|nr:DNA cytosine methyltransferase [Saprospiraceae bacterium]
MLKKKFIDDLHPREAARIQSFPEGFKFPVSETQAYRQIENAPTRIDGMLQCIE